MLRALWLLILACGAAPAAAATTGAGGDAPGLEWLAILLVGAVFGALGNGRQRRTREMRAHLAFEAAPIPMVLADRSLRITEANEAAAALLGGDEREIQMSAVTRWLRAASTQAFADAARAAAAGTPGVVAATLEREGRTLTFDVHISGVEIEEEMTLCLALAEVTARERQHAMFRALHRGLMDAIPVELTLQTGQGEYVFCNPATYLEPDTREWLVGHTDFDLCQRLGWHPEVALRRRAYRKDALAARGPIVFEETVQVGTDERCYSRICVPIYDADGELIAVAGFALDRTERHTLKDAARDALAHAERALKERDRFVENIDAEIRSPLTAMHSAIALLADAVAGSDREMVETLSRNARRIGHALDAMLDVADASGEIEVKPRVVDLVAEVRSTVDVLQPYAQEKGLFLNVNMPRYEMLVRLDPELLYRVLYTILGNAVKFTEAGGVLVEIDQDGGQARVRIMDTGIGLTAEHVPHLFESFDRTTPVASAPAGPVGLSATRRLIDLLDAEFAIDADEGAGTTFELRLPIAMGGTERERVLVAESSVEGAQLLRYALDPFFDLDVVQTAEATREALQSTAYGLLVLDAELFDAEAVAALRRTMVTAPAPIVALDTPGRRAGREEALLADGWDAYVARPFDRHALLDTLSAAVTAG